MVLWIVCLCVSATVLLLALGYWIWTAFAPKRKKRPISPFYITAGAVLLASIAIFIPPYMNVLEGDAAIVKEIALPIHNAIRLFVVDDDFSLILSQTATLGLLGTIYSCYAVVLYVVAPVLTFGLILTFFRNAIVHLKLLFFSNREICIFSEANDKSISLAKDLKGVGNEEKDAEEKKKRAKRVIVFANIKEEETEYRDDLYQMGAITLKDLVTDIRVRKAKTVKVKALECKEEKIVILSKVTAESVYLATNFYRNEKVKKYDQEGKWTVYFANAEIVPIEYQSQLEAIKKAVNKENEKKGIEEGEIVYKESLAHVKGKVEERMKKSVDFQQIERKEQKRKKTLTFFLLSQKEEDNVEQALKLIQSYEKCLNVNLYLIAASDKSEQIFRKLPAMEMKVRRINEYYSLIVRTLYRDGEHIFKSAQYNEQTGENDISALVVGLGKYGRELLACLAWFCQMDGYHAEFHAFDASPRAEDKFREICPELMDEKHNGDFTTKGEAHYKINIYSGVYANTYSFEEQVRALKKITYVFVGMGDDDVNIKAAVRLRILFRRMGINPVIQTVVSNADCLEKLGKADANEYDIKFIGDTKSLYKEKELLAPKINKLALQRHLKWGEEESFWKNEYEYRSSIASAIHTEYKKIYATKIGGHLSKEKRNEEQLWAMRILEHQRWNAYMRSIGYVYTPVRDRSANTHHCLVPFDELPYEEQVKDDD